MLNITEQSWKTAHTTGTAGSCFNWESGHSNEVFLASQGNLFLVKEHQRTLPNSQLDSSLSRETALCKVASLGSKWFKVVQSPHSAGPSRYTYRGRYHHPPMQGSDSPARFEWAFNDWKEQGCSCLAFESSARGEIYIYIYIYI